MNMFNVASIRLLVETHGNKHELNVWNSIEKMITDDQPTEEDIKKEKKFDEFFNKIPTKISLEEHHNIGWLKRPKTMMKLFKKHCEGIWGKLEKPIEYHPIVIYWSEKGRGFGMYSFYQDKGKIYCNNECDDKETVKRILCAMVDQAEFLENRK